MERKTYFYVGRVVRINLVLSSFSLYYFSFFRFLRKIIHTLLSIQRKFIWFGWYEDKRIRWIAWDRVCLPKEKGGLG